MFSASVSAEEITQTKTEICHLSSQFTIRAASESAAKDSNTTEGTFVALRKVDSCTAFGILSDMLLACLPPLTQPSVGGMLMKAVLSIAIRV